VSPSARLKLVAVLAFALGVGVGFFAGVLSVEGARDLFLAMFRSEQQAKVDAPKRIERPSFSLEYPGNWAIDAKDPDYDPDHLFSIDTPGDGFVMFVIAEGELDAADALEQHVANQLKATIKGAKRTAFDRYGSFQGHGALLQGKYLGLAPGSVRIFCFRQGDLTFQITELVSDEDRAKVEPGLRLVEKSLRLAGPKPAEK
jgi:hypothetical protein